MDIMTKTVVIRYDPRRPHVDCDGDDMTFIYGGINAVKDLGFPTPKSVEMLKCGPHRDSWAKGYFKAVIRCTFHA